MSKQKILLLYVVSSSKQIYIPTAVKLRCTSLYTHTKVYITAHAHSLFWTDRWSETQLPLTTNTVSLNVSSKTRLTFWCCGLPTAFFLEFVLEKEIIVYNWNDKYHSHPLIQKYHWNSDFFSFYLYMMGPQGKLIFWLKKKGIIESEDLFVGWLAETHECLEKAHAKQATILMAPRCFHNSWRGIRALPYFSSKDDLVDCICSLTWNGHWPGESITQSRQNSHISHPFQQSGSYRNSAIFQRKKKKHLCGKLQANLFLLWV